MMGAFGAWLLLNKFGLSYWWALILVPLAIGTLGMVIERVMISRLYRLDHLYGLLLTFGLALVIQGLFRHEFGSTGLPYAIPKALEGGQNLGFMFLPNYRAWVIAISLAVCFGTWFIIEKTKLGSYLRASTENPQVVAGLRHQRAGPDHADLRLRRGARRVRGCDGRADLQREPAHGRGPDHRRFRRGRDRRHGLDHGFDRDRFRRSASSKASPRCSTRKHRTRSSSSSWQSCSWSGPPACSAGNDEGRYRGCRTPRARACARRARRVRLDARVLRAGPRRNLPGVPDEGHVLRTVRLRLQPAARLCRTALVRTRDVPRYRWICRGARRKSVGTHARACDTARRDRFMRPGPRSRGCWPSAGRAFISR